MICMQIFRARGAWISTANRVRAYSERVLNQETLQRDRIIPAGCTEHVILDDKVTLKLMQSTSPALMEFVKHKQRKFYTTWIAEAQLQAGGETIPGRVPVVGTDITEGLLEKLYFSLLDELPRQQHSGKEGRRLDLSHVVDEIGSLIVATTTRIEGLDEENDVTYMLMDDDFAWQTWLAKEGNIETLSRVLKEASLPNPTIPILWMSELMEGAPIEEEKPAQVPVAQWTKLDVLNWIRTLPFEDEEDCMEVMGVFRKQKVNGQTLLAYNVDALVADGVPRGSAVLIMKALDSL
mmetsp:Transcript_2601/g.4154  ORF Transcript_2601/g.4154 Transcript_2601/m.4154 type:complete len:293 (-) Transcript_2601:487-1365(-)|eukprot:CAMPEP_0174302416 /NCGR_PEP_ID=MMETSP0809-20121228/59615_1 /TAXON_ID=73025 ORGANISM="Eutreptiella gymnastica-like, Strain CCMP1594" /NCGR_SAMPLE_ID=MMETSP0809 /ASSEMBLY_ACC=CAM_ASM_000658 /LENGTH=292 /DNA_ID=CAMNT_0015408321 /DNA_START=55 /DNA_END=933 /DNA_ORIENTATION=+